MTGEPDEADLAGLLRLLGRLDRAATREHRIEVVLIAEVVHLPEIEVIGLELAEARAEESERAVSRALVRLRSEEDLVARARQLRERGAVVLLALVVGGCGVAVANALA